jgi:hypothetical protein
MLRTGLKKWVVEELKKSKDLAGAHLNGVPVTVFGGVLLSVSRRFVRFLLSTAPLRQRQLSGGVQRGS